MNRVPMKLAWGQADGVQDHQIGSCVWRARFEVGRGNVLCKSVPTIGPTISHGRSAFPGATVGGAAVNPHCALDSISLREMHIAMRTPQHGLGVLSLAAGVLGFVSIVALGSQPPNHPSNDDQQNEVFHATLFTRTSNTKREPTYASSSMAVPAYNRRIAIGPRQPLACRPQISSA